MSIILVLYRHRSVRVSAYRRAMLVGMPPTFRTPTPKRNVRVPTPLWVAAAKVAVEQGESLSEVIRRALASYVERHHQGPGEP
jgi:predicted HicB family RNase H-like nuclease